LRFLRFPLALLVLMFSWGTLNWTGFCFSEYRYLSDQEFLERFLDSNPNILKPELSVVQNQLNDKSIRAITPYKNANEYLELYPTCCQLGSNKRARSEISWDSSIFQRLLNLFSQRVSYRLYWRIHDGTGVSRLTDLYYTGEANNCGQSYVHADN
jgi:hypothetical protein